MAGGHSMAESGFQLQRSRAFVSAEIFAKAGKTIWRKTASTEPRFCERGNIIALAVRAFRALASTEPRFCERGNPARYMVTRVK